ncbi:hypothetical protein HY412_00255 [Candidatus Kaiserbacteria bacterium]|nr:hypothetical protein [Candidatus Kaiserbacteria bacterium]
MESNETKTPTVTKTGGEQKKYVRTFAGDIRTVKKGGTPDLVPLDSAVQTPIDRQDAAPIKTYSRDFAERVKETQASTATILAAEQDASSEPVTGTEEPKRYKLSSILYVIAGVVLLVVGLTGSYIAYTRYLTAVTPIAIKPSVQAPIFVDEREQISGTGTVLLRAIEQSATRTLASGTVRHLYIDPATTTARSVFYELHLPAPSVLLRNLNDENSMAGIVNPAPSSAYGTGGKQYPFFILSVASYGDTFAGMLQWESKMPLDLSAMFPSFTEGFGGSVSSTIPVFVPAFRDEIVANHDMRVYRDAENRSVLLYGYWNQTTLIIARDPEAFIEIAGRLATSRLPALPAQTGQAGTQR